MRRHRERRRDGLRCVMVEALIRKGFLKSETRDLGNAVILAIYAFLEVNLERQKK
jgi:hypothetical protein